MTLHASSHLSSHVNSTEAAATLARELKASFASTPLQLVIVYATVSHDQPVILKTLRRELGSDVKLVGCSIQGLCANGTTREDGFLLGAMGLGGGSLRVATALAREVGERSSDKGDSLGLELARKLGERPEVAIVLYDPLCGADVEQMLSGISRHLSCPLVGGGAGQPFSRMVRTFQYFEEEVLGHAAIAIGLSGPFSAELGVCHGTVPTGVVMTLTRCEGNRLLEIDGRPALDVWREVTGAEGDDVLNHEIISSWAIGIERTIQLANGETNLYFVRAAFGFDLQRKVVIVQAAIPEGSRIMFHHRTVPQVTEGTRAMGRELAQRLAGRSVHAVLGFECGARTSPFLGAEQTLKENSSLRAAIAPEAPWLGMMAWGEIAPVGGAPAFHNYTYPLVVLAGA